MNQHSERTARPGPSSGLGRRVAATLIVSTLIFLVLWIMAFSIMTSLLIAGAFCVVVVAVSTIVDVIGTILDAIATVVLGVLAAIAAVFAAIFGFFSS